MSGEIAVRPNGYDPAKVALIRQMCAPNATDAEFQFYIEQCARLGLDPLLKQVYFQKRGGKASIELGIDGYRAVADATGEYAGCDEPSYTGHGTLPNGKSYPKLCAVTVYRLVQGQRCGFTGQAAWQDFYNANNAMWNSMPYRMLSIRAETTALKKAFPRQLQGTYTPDEMDDAEQKPMQPEIVDPPLPTPPVRQAPPEPQREPKVWTPEQLAAKRYLKAQETAQVQWTDKLLEDVLILPEGCGADCFNEKGGLRLSAMSVDTLDRLTRYCETGRKEKTVGVEAAKAVVGGLVNGFEPT